MTTVAPKCISIGQYRCVPGWVGKRHTHPFLEIILVLSGKLAVEMGDMRVTLGPGDALLYPMNVPHTERAAGDEPSDFYAATVEADFHSPQIITQDMSGRMRMLSKWLIEEYYQMAPGKTALMQAFMRAFLAEYQRVSSQHRSELVETVHAYLRKNLDQRLTVTQIARQVNMSRAHFMRLYKRLTGKTPMEVLRTLRVEAARDLIITTDQPLRSIAPQVGFCDQYQLSRVFRKLLQVTPGHFRRQACSGTGTER